MNRYIEVISDDIKALDKLYGILLYCLKYELYPFSDPEDHDILVDGLDAMLNVINEWDR